MPSFIQPFFFWNCKPFFQKQCFSGFQAFVDERSSGNYLFCVADIDCGQHVWLDWGAPWQKATAVLERQPTAQRAAESSWKSGRLGDPASDGLVPRVANGKQGFITHWARTN